MTTINSRYPSGLKNKEIKKAMNEYFLEIYENNASTNKVLQLSPLIQLGQIELQGRLSKRIAITTIALSVISVAFAAIALIMSNKNDKAMERWEARQIHELKEIEAYNKQLIHRLDSLISKNNSLLLHLKDLQYSKYDTLKPTKYQKKV